MCDLLDWSVASLFFFFFSLFRVGVASCFRNSITCVVAKVIALMVDWFGGWMVALLVR